MDDEMTDDYLANYGPLVILPLDFDKDIPSVHHSWQANMREIRLLEKGDEEEEDIMKVEMGEEDDRFLNKVFMARDERFGHSVNFGPSCIVPLNVFENMGKRETYEGRLLFQREEKDQEVKLEMGGGGTSFFSKLLARDEEAGQSFEVQDGRAPGVGVPFGWEAKPGTSRANANANAKKDSLKFRVLTPPPFQARDEIEANMPDGSSTTRRKRGLFHKIKNTLFGRKVKDKSKHVACETSARISNFIVPARRSISEASHSIGKFIMPRKSI
ncbi:hypothetical protein SUGI_0907200 [Cryptomeria japonica]|nr:hypothetical protein SUGI_0907200 [Cryptomeria japonica]